jgi:hypothetical protein
MIRMVARLVLPKPIYNQLRSLVGAHRLLWATLFPQSWEKIPLDQKLIWILCINNLLAILTIIEVFVLKHFNH